MWYARYGRWTLTFGYYIPGVRHVVAIAAGASELKWRTFAVFAYSGALLWVSTFLVLGSILGRQWARVSPRVHAWMLGIAAGVVVIGLLIATARRWRRRAA